MCLCELGIYRVRVAALLKIILLSIFLFRKGFFFQLPYSRLGGGVDWGGGGGGAVRLWDCAGEFT